MEYFTRGIVLNKSDIKEYDRIFSIYTKNLGKTSIFAKGVRRSTSKMAGHLEPFGLLAIKIVQGRGGNRLSNIETIKRYQNIIQDFDFIKLASQCLAAVDELIKEGSCDLGILNLLEQILDLIDDKSLNINSKVFLKDVFLCKLISHLGYQPELYNCVVCHHKIKPDNNIFHLVRGGIVCPNCQEGTEGLPISVEEIKILRLIISEDLKFFSKNKINKELAQKVGKIINNFVAVIKD